MHLKQMQKAGCYTAPLVCDLSVCTSQAVVGGWINYIYIRCLSVPFLGCSINAVLGILTERLALLTIISVGVS